MRKFLFLLLISPCFGQAWSNILTNTRAIDWTKTGLPPTITYGTGGSSCNGSLTNCVETTTNAWTPPTRVQSGSTITCANTTADAGTINTALAAAKPGSYVLIAAGTCDITSNINMVSGVTLRGSGASSTVFNYGSAVTISWGSQSTLHNGAISGSPAAGATSLTIAGSADTGSGMAGNIARLSQCNTGFTAWTSYQNCTGTSGADNGQIYTCDSSGCAVNAPNSGGGEVQIIYVTSVTGNCTSSCTVNFSPPLAATNWSSSNFAHLEWGPGGIIGAGLEDLEIIRPSSTIQNTSSVSMNGYAPWVKGVQMIGPAAVSPVHLNIAGLNGLVMNNYTWGQGNTAVGSGDTEPIDRTTDTYALILNNIATGGEGFWGAGYLTGEALVYNYGAYDQTSNCINNIINHGDGMEFFTYAEGNEIPIQHSDDNHTSNFLFTGLRNWFSFVDGASLPSNCYSVAVDNFQRFDNYVGNIIGSSIPATYISHAYGTVAYQSSASRAYWIPPTSDNLATAGWLRWGNVTITDGVPRWCGRTDPNFASAPCSSTSEMPDSTTMSSGSFPNATSWQNTTPANHNIPCTFIFSSSTSPCTILTSGGTGLSWWKVCKTWTTFPTACATTQTQPYPTFGPDQTGGPYLGGYAYDIPAAVAFKNLPIQTSYQHSWPITASSWTNSSGTCSSFNGQAIVGPCETLTVTMNTAGNTYHVVGPMQLSGVNAACIPTSGISNLGVNNEILILGNTEVNTTTVTIIYALPGVSSDPGCTGNMLWPDVRQFDERVYLNDPGNAGTFTCSPSNVPSHHSAHISLTCTGVGTSWTSSTAFTASAPATFVSATNNSATSETVVITTGASTGTSTITDTTDTISTTITVSAATFGISPISGVQGVTGCTTTCQGTLTLTGTNTIWTLETAAGLFSVGGASCSGFSIGTPTVTTNTSATALLTWGPSVCTMTVTDTSTTQTATFSVLPAPIVSGFGFVLSNGVIN